MFKPLAEWIATTNLSLILQTHGWIVPTSQSLHIIGVCMLFTGALVINSRILGVGSNGRSVPQLADALLPWMWSALALLVATGAVQTIAEPVRQFITPMFWAKMAMIIVVVVMTVLYSARIRAYAGKWIPGSPVPAGVRSFAVVSTALWTAIIVCGRFIGYTWALYLQS